MQFHSLRDTAQFPGRAFCVSPFWRTQLDITKESKFQFFAGARKLSFGQAPSGAFQLRSRTCLLLVFVQAPNKISLLGGAAKALSRGELEIFQNAIEIDPEFFG